MPAIVRDDDQKAAMLAEQLAWYLRISIREGATLDETGDMTIRELASDLVAAHPRHLPELPAEIRELSA